MKKIDKTTFITLLTNEKGVAFIGTFTAKTIYAETFSKKELKQLPHKSLSQLVLYAIAYQKKE